MRLSLVVWVLSICCVVVFSKITWKSADASDILQKDFTDDDESDEEEEEEGGLKQKDSMDDYESDVPREVAVRHGADLISSTLSQNGAHYGDITADVTVFDDVYVLDLYLNSRLFAPNYVEKIVTADGEKIHDVDHAKTHCFYLGTVRNRAESSAAISTCNGITGHFTVGNMTYYIEPQSRDLTGHHVVRRSLPSTKSASIFDADQENLLESLLSKSRVKRSFMYPHDLDQVERVLELYVVNDFSQFKARGSEADVYQRTKATVNIASHAFQKQSIYIVVVGIEVWGDANTIDATSTDSGLIKWVDYRMRKINPLTFNDHAVLITAKSLYGGNGGVYYPASMCSNQKSGSILRDSQKTADLSGLLLARLLGSSFGIAPDTNGCSCTDKSGQCIMSGKGPTAGVPTEWSVCSQNQFITVIRQGLGTCLYDGPDENIQTPLTPTCGNGIVEDGEMCDCGIGDHKMCNSACCDPKTCQLKDSATCAYGRCCNIEKCQIQMAGLPCRMKSNACDLTESCDGSSFLCPADTHKQDGTPCIGAVNSSSCYNGVCGDPSNRCELLYGPKVRSSNDICYDFLNKEGSERGNCGVNWTAQDAYVPCQESDRRCGRLQCESNGKTLANNRLFYKKSEARVNSHSCNSVIFDYGLKTRDPGLVPDGAYCYDGKLCVNQKCVSDSSIQRPSCNPACKPSEVCNNLGKCQTK